jgi:hypothetical protein
VKKNVWILLGLFLFSLGIDHAAESEQGGIDPVVAAITNCRNEFLNTAKAMSVYYVGSPKNNIAIIPLLLDLKRLVEALTQDIARRDPLGIKLSEAETAKNREQFLKDACEKIEELRTRTKKLPIEITAFTVNLGEGLSVSCTLKPGKP